jgi:hypothetical protein
MNNEFDIINNAVYQYTLCPTLENFILISDAVQPSMLRGFCNEDNYGHGSAIYHSVVDIALVYKEIKPMTVQFRKSPIIKQLNLNILHTCRRNQHIYVIYKNNNKDNAIRFIDYLAREKRADSNEEHFHTMGQYLGYPQKDIDYFIQNNC